MVDYKVLEVDYKNVGVGYKVLEVDYENLPVEYKNFLTGVGFEPTLYCRRQTMTENRTSIYPAP